MYAFIAADWPRPGRRDRLFPFPTVARALVYEMATQIAESEGKDWIGPLRSNRQVTFDGEEKRVNALEEFIDTEERKIDHETYNI